MEQSALLRSKSSRCKKQEIESGTDDDLLSCFCKPKGARMSRFDNKLCPVCRSPFGEGSDIVVCPDCGTPHHRICYLKNNRCALEGLHAEGFVWNGALPDEKPPEAPRTEAAGASEAERQTDDPHYGVFPGGEPGESGAPGDGPEVQSMSFEEFLKRMNSEMMDDTRGEDGVSSKELAYFVGRSVMHYSQAFAAFRAAKKRRNSGVRGKLFFNICSGLFAPIHQFYRGMFGLGAVLLLVNAVSQLPVLLTDLGVINPSAADYAAVRLFLGAFGVAVTVLMCLFGDYLYYRFSVRRIKQIRAQFDDGRGEGYYEALNAVGSPSWLRAIIGVLLIYFLSACLSMLPSWIGG